jgi:class 3 adenylate cyclase
MRCPRCGHENRAAAKFCEECAGPLARRCANCGGELSTSAKFCPECAHPVATVAAVKARPASPATYTPKHLAEKILTSRSALEGERKQVTVIFADLKGSMELLADRDSEEARKILDPVLERMMEAVHRYEGTVNQVMGDGIMALFGAPLAHEDNLAALPADWVHEYFGLPAPASVYSRHWLVMSLARLGRFVMAAEYEAEAIRLAEPTQHAFSLAFATGLRARSTFSRATGRGRAC